ncbi:MAG: hypothetical protein ABW133_21785 [Polyangiaceae bacterium]
MRDFFIEGGWAMYPVLILGLVLLASSGRYATDLEPIRLRFIGVLSLALVVFIAAGVVINTAMVFWYLQSRERVPDAEYLRILAEGLKEASRPANLGLPMLGVGLILVSIGFYRDGRRELAAVRG